MRLVSWRLSAFVPLLPLVLLFATPARAQYMYLDTNGDGAHTTDDLVSPSGTTTVDVWIATDVNRDGSPVICSSGDGDLSIAAYEFILRSSNGTVLWSAFTNRRPEFGGALGEASSATEYYNGRSPGAHLAPGKYWLASVSVEIATGTPAIAIVASTTLGVNFITAFFSNCSGIDFDNTLKLGSDWFDVDNIPYGGAANRPPVLGPVADMTVAETATASQDVVAEDPDGGLVGLRLAAGPDYAAMESVESTPGRSVSRIVLTPGYEDAGTDGATVEASDGILSDARTIAITVMPTNRAPTFHRPPDVSMKEGERTSRLLAGDDPDRDLLSFLLVSGPAFVTVSTDDRVPPATGLVELAPGFADAGTHPVTVAVTDGFVSVERSFTVQVSEGFTYRAPILLAPLDMTVRVGDTADQTLRGLSPGGESFAFGLDSGPAFMSVTTVSSAPDGAIGQVHLAPGPGDAGVHVAMVAAMAGPRRDTLPIRITVIDADDPPPIGPLDFGAAFLSMEVGLFPEDVAIGDLDGDGHEDLVSADLFGRTLTLLFGEGDGSFPQRQTYEVGGAPFAAAIGDVNRDGRADIAFVDSTSYIVTILPGRGSRLFGERIDYRTGARPAYLTLHDVSGDGWLDIIVPNEDDNTVSVFLGQQGGTFPSRADYPVGDEPCQQGIADLNADGIQDLVVVNEHSDTVSILLGTGGGTFGTQRPFATGDDPRTVEIGDLSGDGIPDLAVPNFFDDTASVLLGLGDGRFAARVDYPTGRLPWGLALGDFNRDGRLDVATANALTSDVSVFLGDGSGGLNPRADIPTGNIPRTVRSKDMNHDGRIDLIVDNEGANTMTLLTGNGDGTFGTHHTLAEGTSIASITAGDVDGDGIADYLLPKPPSSVSLHLGLSGGGSAPPIDLEIGAPPNGIVLGDWNADRIMDIAVLSSASKTATVLLGQGGTSFGPRIATTAGTSPFRGAASDLNGDGHLDLIVDDSVARSFVTLFGRGDGTFDVAAGPTLEGIPQGFAVADWNRDGVLDVVVGEAQPGGISLFFGDPGGAFLVGPRVPLPEGPFGIGGAGDVAIGDLEGDGVPELVAVSFGSDTFFGEGKLLTFHRGDGGLPVPFSERPAGRQPTGLVLEDLNRDGLPEAIVSDAGSRALFVFNAGRNGVFGNRTDFGTGTGVRASIGDWTGDGNPDLVVATPNLVRAYPNRAPRPPRALPARAFVTGENLVVRLGSGKPTTCVQLEPLSGSFQLGDVDPASLAMRSTGTGTVEEIAGIIGKSVAAGDRDKNGVPDLTVCFSKEALGQLFAGVAGTQVVPVKLRGRLHSGERLEAALDLNVIGESKKAVRVTLAPNPLNPTATLTVETAKAGPLRARVFDASGRLVRTLADLRLAPAGVHALRIDAGSRGARGGGGGELPSGIYFYRVETIEGARSGRLVVVK